jgi:hypothetical protein
MATHNPIIAAQFEPCERVILDFDDEGKVFARKGVSATGDDPNDLLVHDFNIRSLLGTEGIIKWERYLELKNIIRKESEPVKKEKLVEELMEIGSNYNFGNEIR